MLQQATETAFIPYPGLLGLLIIAGVILYFYWRNTHCPNCKRIFTRKVVKKEKGGLLPTMISGRERRTYQCSHCNHKWDKVIHVDGA
jgi:hypothetical protein